MRLEAQRKALAEIELDTAARIDGLEADHVPLDGAALSKPTADDAADAVLGHEVEGRLRAALERLPPRYPRSVTFETRLIEVPK